MATDFDALNREAYERGRRDAYRDWEQSDEERWARRGNPFIHNDTQAEAEHWQEGYNDETEELKGK